MFIFCGSSSVRQFLGDRGGLFSYTIFSGSTIKGLMRQNSVSGHGAVMRHFAQAPMRKTMFFMFGNTDLDFTFYRSFCINFEIDTEQFILDRINSYNSFLSAILQDDPERSKIHALCVLAPQPTPLRDEYFFRVTSEITGVPEERLLEAAAHLDLSHRARIERAISFNDALENGILKDDRVRFYRADRKMLNESGVLLDRFFPKDVQDHHAEKRHTVRLWKGALKREFSSFRQAATPKRAKARKHVARTARPVAVS